MINFPRNNNFEWLRFIFAAQVVLVHGAEHLGFKLPHQIFYFPGVPAFFFVSGFLIYASYLNTPGKRYYTNRGLRLFPGLFFVTTGGVALALFAHGTSDFVTHFSTYGVWLVAQLTLGQAYNPAHFRDIGVGVINGSLWTITTEMLFYLCVPLIVAMERRFRHTLWILIIISFTFYATGAQVWSTPVYRDKTVYEILSLTPLAWGWMFGFGMLAMKHYNRYQSSIKYFIISLPLMLLMTAYAPQNVLSASYGNHLGIVYFLLYTTVILWVAFGIPYVNIPFDFSYGAYIWHMPVINFLIIVSIRNILLAISLTFAIAAFSWFFIEKPALKLKKHSLKPVT